MTSLGGLTVLLGWLLNSSPRGATSASGCVTAAGSGLTWPKPLEPQQATAPLLLTPQLWESPALRAPNVPAGGVARPSVSSPRQASVASFLIRRSGHSRCATALKSPPGGAGMGAPLELWPPQQARVPASASAQPWVPPAPTSLKLPGGGFPRPNEL